MLTLFCLCVLKGKSLFYDGIIEHVNSLVSRLLDHKNVTQEEIARLAHLIKQKQAALEVACETIGMKERKRQQGELARLRQMVETDERYAEVRVNLLEYILSLFRDALLDTSSPPPVPEITSPEQALATDRPYEIINIEKAVMDNMLIKPNNIKPRRWGLESALVSQMALYYPPPPNMKVGEMKALIVDHFNSNNHLPPKFNITNYKETLPKSRTWNNILKPRLKEILQCLDRFASSKNLSDLQAIEQFFVVAEVDQ